MKLTNLIGKIILVAALLCGKAALAQVTTTHAAILQNGPNGKAVEAWYTAWEKKDWNLMQRTLADGFTFSSPLDDHITIAAMKKRCWPNAYKIKKFDLDKIVVNGDQIVVISNGWTTSGKLARNSDYFKLKDGKILAYECFFGPGINYPLSGK